LNHSVFFAVYHNASYPTQEKREVSAGCGVSRVGVLLSLSDIVIYGASPCVPCHFFPNHLSSEQFTPSSGPTQN
jgi:hypothetical protein